MLIKMPLTFWRVVLGISSGHRGWASPPVLKRLDGCRVFHHRVTVCRQPLILVRGHKQFHLHHASPVRQREELHRLAGNLVMRALLNGVAGFDSTPG